MVSSVIGSIYGTFLLIVREIQIAETGSNNEFKQIMSEMS